MTDRELLEFAAKAEGRTWMSYSTGSGKGLCCRDTRFGGLIDYYWNPLTDDGDALRLAVKCEISVWQAGDFAVADHDALGPKMRVAHNSDPYAATRRAIVRAAAELGEE